MLQCWVGIYIIDIFICMDSSNYRKEVRNLVESIIRTKGYHMKVLTDTNDIMCTKKQIEKSKNSGIYFLGIKEETQTEKIDLATYIRKKDKSGVIIFLSNSYNMAASIISHRIEAMTYMVKEEHSQWKNQIDKCLLQANEKIGIRGYNSDIFIIEKSSEIIPIGYDNIIYFQASSTPHKVQICTKDKSIEFYGTLSKIEGRLNKNLFYRCHKSFVINLTQVEKLDKDKKVVRMNNGSECFISDRRIDEFIDRLYNLNNVR